jgi:hypothetical protein
MTESFHRVSIMRQRTRDGLTFLTFILAFGVTLAAMAAPRWIRPRGLGVALAVLGWTVFALFNVGQALVLWGWVRRPLARRPWILGGPPNPSPHQDSAKRTL